MFTSLGCPTDQEQELVKNTSNQFSLPTLIDTNIPDPIRNDGASDSRPVRCSWNQNLEEYSQWICDRHPQRRVQPEKKSILK